MPWAYLTRAGGEHDLCEELGDDAKQIASSVVLVKARPERDPAFARQAMRTFGNTCEATDPERLVEQLHRVTSRERGEPVWDLQVVAPDSVDPNDRRRSIATSLEETLGTLLEFDDEQGTHLAQIWILDEHRCLVGATATKEALSPHPGGRIRLRRERDAPSRAGLKLAEAIAWIGVGPEKGEQCADLGAAPGGWSQIAVGRGAKVIGIDPARITLELPRKKFQHLAQNAFEYAPEETLDWLLCDMAWRPLEVAQLVSKWGRRGWARQFFVNFKLPMKKKAEMLEQILPILEEAGWKGLRARQLYHDRDEVTVYAWLDPIIVRRGAQPAFSFRSRAKKAPRRKRRRRR